MDTQKVYGKNWKAVVKKEFDMFYKSTEKFNINYVFIE